MIITWHDAIIVSLLKKETVFENVPKDAYYAKAVEWATVAKVTNGTSDKIVSAVLETGRGVLV